MDETQRGNEGGSRGQWMKHTQRGNEGLEWAMDETQKGMKGARGGTG